MDTWIVIVEDRHADTDAFPFSTEERAVRYAREKARQYATRPEDVEEHELTASMLKDGWVLYVEYSVESDSVRVVKRTVDAAT